MTRPGDGIVDLVAVARALAGEDVELTADEQDEVQRRRALSDGEANSG